MRYLRRRPAPEDSQPRTAGSSPGERGTGHQRSHTANLWRLSSRNFLVHKAKAPRRDPQRLRRQIWLLVRWQKSLSVDSKTTRGRRRQLAIPACRRIAVATEAIALVGGATPRSSELNRRPRN